MRGSHLPHRLHVNAVIDVNRLSGHAVAIVDEERRDLRYFFRLCQTASQLLPTGLRAFPITTGPKLRAPVVSGIPVGKCLGKQFF